MTNTTKETEKRFLENRISDPGYLFGNPNGVVDEILAFIEQEKQLMRREDAAMVRGLKQNTTNNSLDEMYPLEKSVNYALESAAQLIEGRKDE